METKVAEVVVRILEDEGVDTAFGIPGAAINPVYQYLGKSTKIRHYIVRHEEAAVHAADGYFRVTGKIALAICTSGPAATNLVTGLYTAQVDSVPVVAITGQNVRAQLGKEAFQCVDICRIAGPVTKAAWSVIEPSSVPSILRKAFHVAREGRPGPVLIDLPLDVQLSTIPFDGSGGASLPVERPGCDATLAGAAIRLLEQAERPLILVGGGVVLAGAWEEAISLAERWQIPIVTTLMGKGAIPPDHPLYAGQVGIQTGTPCGNDTFLKSDLVLGLGCRFSDRHTGPIPVYTKGRRFIQVDIEPTQIGRVLPVDLGIASDVRSALRVMLELTDTVKHPAKGWAGDVSAKRRSMARRTDIPGTPIAPQRVFKEINEFFDDTAIFTTGCGITQIWSGQLQEIRKPKHYLVSGGAGTLGFDLPAAIGARLGDPSASAVVAIMGDAGFLFLVEELATACQYEIPVIVIIVNNGYLGLIRQNQKYAYGYEYAVSLTYGSDGLGVDFPKLAQSFGAYGERVFDPDQIRPALGRAMQACREGRPAVVDVIVARHADCSMGPSIDKITEF